MRETSIHLKGFKMVGGSS